MQTRPKGTNEVVASSIVIAALLGIAIGCGDSDDDARPRYRADLSDPAITEDTQVSMLGTTEREEVCRSYDAYVETYVSFEAIAYIACLPPAIVLGGNEEGCEQRLADCMALFPEPIEVRANVQAVEACVDRLGSCDASIVELEGCANVNLDLVLDIFDNWSCGGLNDDRIAEAARVMDTVSVCADVDDPCAEAVVIGPD